MTSILEGLLKKVAAPDETGDAFLARFGMLRNPFPPARTIYPEIIYNQENALHLFAEGVVAIAGPTIERRAVAVLGGTGQGKSHFQRHCQYWVARENVPVVAVEFLAGTVSAAALVREMLRSADEHVKRNGEQDLLSAIVSRLEPGEYGPVRQTDLRSALRSVVASAQPNFIAEDRDGRFSSDVLLDVCRRWLNGETLTQTERRYLHVSGRLATASLMTRVVSELFALARGQGLFQGVMICLDEVEALFFSGVTTSRIQAFLQDLRYLFDEAKGKSSGYSLLILAGSTARGARDLREYNYPLFQRLGFETEARVQLQEVQDFNEARRFADVYLQFERNRAEGIKRFGPNTRDARALISDDDLRSAFEGPSGDTRSQARLLESLHKIVEEKKRMGVDG